MSTRRGFGAIQVLPSKRLRARYIGPDGERVNAPTTFETRGDAEGWLAAEHRLIQSGAWTSPAERVADARRAQADVILFERYALDVIAARSLKPRTREHYASLLTRILLPAFGTRPLTAISPESVRVWHGDMGTGTPTQRAHAYGLLRMVLSIAVDDGLIPANPCHIRGAGNSKRVHKVQPLTLDELATLTDAMPDRLRAMVQVAAWCGLRFGELTELRRRDIDLAAGVLMVRRGVVRTDGGFVVGTPKSDAGVRDVSIPPHLLDMLRDHMADHVLWGKDALLFTAAAGGGHLAPSSLYGRAPKGTDNGWGFYRARAIAGRPDLRWHDLRHTGAVLAASAGASLPELMGRLGHSTAEAALIYQHVAAGRDTAIAARLSELAAAHR